MGKTFAEKLLAAKANEKEVIPGKIINASPDVLMCSASTFAVSIKQFRRTGIERIWDPERLVVILDHFVPADSVQTANNHKLIREFVREQGIKNFYDIKAGVCHQVMVEKCHALPGTLILGKDSHTISYGAVASFSSGIGATETASILAVGTLWLRVPESVKIILKGRLQTGVCGKDIALRLVKDFTTDGCNYKCVEFTGDSVVDLMSVSDRFTLANMCVEMGAKASYFPFDKITEEFCEKRGFLENTHYKPILPDEDAHYENTYELDIATLEPFIARPNEIDNITRVSEAEGLEIHQGFLGSCTNGRIEDMEIAARLLTTREIHRNVRLLISPASTEVYLEALDRGYLKIFAEAGATILNPNCSACFGAHQGILADGERCISSSNRNFRGRMGNVNSEVYLASPASVVASCITGYITDPRKFLTS
jgi:3-isopropylmalate/(R)-2-methylmalate dehydratase large subunit